MPQYLNRGDFIKKIEEFFEKHINRHNYRKYLTVDIFLIVVCMFILVSYASFAYYDESFSLKLLNSQVGNFRSYNSDISIMFYQEKQNDDGSGMGEYKPVSEVPRSGFAFNNYTCKNSSTIEYNQETKEVVLSSNTKDECNIYFNATNTSDLDVAFMIEDGLDTDNYQKMANIPIYGYKYDHYDCVNNSEIIYDDVNERFQLNSTQKDTCNIYYKKLNNLHVNVYIRKNNTLELITSLPKTKSYQLSTGSECRVNYKPVSSNISFNNKKITIDTDVNASCDVYLEEVPSE